MGKFNPNCTICGTLKTAENTRLKLCSRDSKKYINSHCKKCEKLSAAKYREVTKEERAVLAKKWYAANKEKKALSGKAYRARNKEKLASYLENWKAKNSAKIAIYRKAYYESNKKELVESSRIYRIENPDKVRETAKKCRVKRRDKRNSRSKERYENDPNFKISLNLRTRVRQALKAQNAQKNYHLKEYLGCSPAALWEHLIAKFQPGMTVENHGKWHIDHVRPCVSFDLTDPAQQLECFHFTNLQPLWSAQNLSKGAKWENNS